MKTTASRRAVLVHAVSAGVPLLWVGPARAQSFPPKQIRIIVGFNPGGTSDSVARLYAQKLAELLGNTVIVENKPGANQITAINALKSSAPDGATLYVGTGSSMVQNPVLRRGLGYDPQKDFTLVGLACTNPGLVFANNDLPVKTLADLVAWGQAHPGKLNYGSAGLGTAGHLAAEALMSATGLKMTHIPYKNDAEVIREVIAGTLNVGIMTTLNTVQAVKGGRIKALAVTTARRLPYLPDVPALPEAALKGLDALEPHTFISFVGPAGMAPETVAALNQAMRQISAMPDVASRVRENFYAEPAALSLAEFRRFLDEQLALWREIGKTVKLGE